MKYENTFKAIDQILWKEQGCGSELDYLEQKSWMLFLKYLDDLKPSARKKPNLKARPTSVLCRASTVGASGQRPRSATRRRARWC